MSASTPSTAFSPQAKWSARQYAVRAIAVRFIPHVEPVTAADGVPEAGRLVSVDDELHRVLAHIDRRLVLSHVTTNAIYLVQEGSAGDLRLPTFSAWRSLTRTGRAMVLPNRGCGDGSTLDPGIAEVRRISLQCDMLDEAEIPLGSKAMLIWLHRHWTPDLVAIHGHHDSAETLRRWRRIRNRGTCTRP